MPSTNYKNSKKLKFILISIILVILGATVFIFISYRRDLNQGETGIVPAIQSRANIILGKVHQTATRDGIKEWSLDASSARVIHAKKQAVFQDVKVVFFLKDKTKVYLNADQGILNTESNDIEVSGNVVVKKQSYYLKTERLTYQHNRKILRSEVPVKIISTSSTLSGDSMAYDLNTNQTRLEGNIKGIFSDKFIL